MNALSEISDEDFVPFLINLGAETYKKSFEWMLNDTNFAGVLRWMYKNLDQNNALTAREEYRYIELEKKGCLLSSEDLEASISNIQEEFPGVCTPGDEESREDVELEVEMMKERLNMLEKQEDVMHALLKQNELVKEELTKEQIRLSAALRQYSEDESSAGEDCKGLAQDLESLTDDVVDVIAENLEVYTSSKNDKDLASRFFSFAPLDSYRQTQSLFLSHFDLFVSKHLVNKQNGITHEELRTALIEARAMEERLSAAAFAYIESKAALSGEQAKLALVSNYNNVHPSQITSVLMETPSALEFLEQEENILQQQIQKAVAEFVQGRSNLAVNTAAASAVNVRQKMLSSLTNLCDIWQHAYSLDRLLYSCLRHELRTLEEFLQFATQLMQHVVAESNAVSKRIQSMAEICADQESCEQKMQTSNELLNTLFKILGALSSDETVFVKLFNDMQADVKELSKSADDGLRRREEFLIELKESSKPLSEHIFDGCTKHPNCWDRTVAALNHSLQYEMDIIDKRVIDASSLFTSVKNGDKQCLRKMWQWFLTDPPKLLAAIKNATSSMHD